MKCPRCNSNMYESYDAKTGNNRMYECDECGFNQNAFDAVAASEGYPADSEEFERWQDERGF